MMRWTSVAPVRLKNLGPRLREGERDLSETLALQFDDVAALHFQLNDHQPVGGLSVHL